VLHPDVERLGLRELRPLQDARWAAQWERVRLASSFYRRKLGAACDRILTLDDLTGIEPTTKDELRASQEVDPPFGDYAACPPDRVIRLHRTSGTTGRGMHLAYTAADAEVVARTGARAMRAAGLMPGDRVVHCLNYQLWTGGVTDHLILEAAGATVIPFGVGNTRQLIDVIRELGVNAISCTPSYPALIEQVLREETDLEPPDLGLRLALFGGEAGLDDGTFRERLEATWGFAARNANFGLSEIMSILGSQCEHTTDLHLHARDAVYVELLDPDSRERLPIEEGVTGELVCTHLEKECQPLVRYATRDLVAVTGTGPCACGREAFRFRIAGRTDDMFNVRGVNVFPGAVRAVVEGLPDVASGHFRIHLAGPGPYDRIDLRLEAAREVAPGSFDDIGVAVAEAVRSRIGASASVTVLPHGALGRTAGKTSLVVRE
jgi:phenylacetate-CoA ligase